MKVANPIYDVVFKYLMDDKKIARLIISKIIGEDIVDLDFRPTELNKKVGNSTWTVYRIDFAATIKRSDGSKKLVLIEIQKAKYHTDIMRFRKYLGHHYQDKKNIYKDEQTHQTKALPIICLYFLGHKLEHTDAPVVKVQRKYVDLADPHRTLSNKEDFIESLTHDSYIIQIPQLKERRRNSLEVLLSIFDQSLRLTSDDHFLDLNEDDYPEEFKLIIRHLIRAAAEVDICETMELEDEILDQLENLERKVLAKDKALKDNAKALEDKDKALEDKDKALEDKDKALEDKDKALEDKDKALEDKDKALEDKEDIINSALKALVDSGVSIKDAKKILSLP